MKVVDGTTGRESWRGVRRGILRDFDSDPTSKNYNKSQMKKAPHHSAHEGGKRRGSVPHMGYRDTKEGPEEQ
ncbi:MAG TPA: hypothetical protein VI911_11965 [Patescibacteria group bacterium]|nr:hypothetical protein [Patescibacteria group bacterium]